MINVQLGKKDIAVAFLVILGTFIATSLIMHHAFLLSRVGANVEFSYPRIYLLLFVFHVWLASLLLRRYKRSVWLFLFCIATPFMIDATVYVSGRELIPFRAPIATLFPIFGTGVAFWIHAGKRGLAAVVTISVLLLVFALHQYFIPWELERKYAALMPVVRQDIFDMRFRTTSGDFVRFGDTTHGSVQLVECYFVGCPPCEQKAKMLLQLREATDKGAVDMVMICSGKATKWERFLEHAEANKTPGIIYLYDAYNVMDSLGDKPIPFFPTEFLYHDRRKEPLTTLGFDAPNATSILEEKKTLIKNWLVADSINSQFQHR